MQKYASASPSHVAMNLNLGSRFIVVHSDEPNGLTFHSQRVSEKGSQACSMHIMAAVALSELASTIPDQSEGQLPERKEVSTQTENDLSPYLWLNSVHMSESSNLESKVTNLF